MFSLSLSIGRKRFVILSQSSPIFVFEFNPITCSKKIQGTHQKTCSLTTRVVYD